MFLRLTHELFHASNGISVNWQMVLPLVHLINLGP